MVAVRDELKFRTDHLRAPTVIDVTMPDKERFSINRISVVLFEDDEKLLPLTHPLWWTSIFRFKVRSHDIYAWPLHRFIDPVVCFAFAHDELELNAVRRCIGAMASDFEFPYILFACEAAECIIEPRNPNNVPLTASAMVLLSGQKQFALGQL